MIYKLSEESIQSHVGEAKLVEQGHMIIKTKGVISLKRNDDSIHGFVRSSREDFKVTVKFNHHNMVKKSTCNCAKGQQKIPCRHIAAVLLSLVFDIPETLISSDNYGFILNYFNEMNVADIESFEAISIEVEQSTSPFNELLESVVKREISKKPVKLSINIVVDKVYRQQEEAMIWTVDFKMGEDRLYVVKSLPLMVECLLHQRRMDFSQRFTFNPQEHYINQSQERLLIFMDELQHIYRKADSTQTFYSAYESYINGKYLQLNNDFLIKQFIAAISDLRFNIEVFYDEWGSKIEVDTIEEEELKIPIIVSGDDEKTDEGIDVELKAVHSVIPLTSDYEYVMYEDRFIHLKTTTRDLIRATKEMAKKHGDSIRVASSSQAHFFTKVYPRLSEASHIRIPEHIRERLIEEELVTKVYFERTKKKGILAKIHFVYGEHIIDAGFDKVVDTKVFVLRNGIKENEVLRLFKNFDSVEEGFYLDNEEKMYEFTRHELEALSQVADVFYEKGMMPLKHSFSTITHTVGLSMDDYLEVEFEGVNYSTKELSKVYSAIKEKKSYVRLKDGSFLSVGEQKVQDYFELLDELDISIKEMEENKALIPLNRAFAFEKLSEEGHFEVIRSERYQEFLDQFKSLEAEPYPLLKPYDDVMRDYQKVGYRWLGQLSAYKLGGILADDMGLGKTLQAIALVDAIHHLDKRPSLIIAPTSLVYNWQAEVEKFAPHLSVLVIAGTKQERLNLLEQMEEHTIVITSYALVRIDLDHYKEKQFARCIIDEAQNIKNPNAKTTRAVKRVRAGGYLALTGTPIENNLTELWSIFDFVMPGYLRTHSKFSERFEKPISLGDKQALNHLKYYIKPFILRRMKKDVLTELPPKIETKAVVHMTKEQQKLYMAYLKKAKESMEEDIKTSGYGKSKIKIFSYLTRLRQICCHPETFVEDYHGGSGKLEMLQELLADGIEAGHKILVFSQFTSMLSIIKDMLDEQFITYEYLDGSTKAKDRQVLVNRFNESDTPVFLISLKAGGTGLNLTGADIVIHYDPWWNPAVEEQATDRAYRIGQTESVQVFKLITEGSIEDKIFQLQEKKREMIASVIEPGETLIEKLSESELRSLFE